MSRKAYRATLVKKVMVEEVHSRLNEGALWIGVDLGKSEALAVVRDSRGTFERPWKVKLPGEIREFVSRMQWMQDQRELTG